MALPKEPRQKMINIMYLVLTALLALNVSAEILNAFETVNTSLLTANSIVDGKNSQVIKNMDEQTKKAETAERAKQWLPRAQEARRLAGEMSSYIDNMKAELKKESDGQPDGTYKLDDIDAATRLMIERKKGEELYNKIEGFKKSLLGLHPDIAKTFQNTLPLDLTVPKSRTASVNRDWTTAYFHMTPTVAAITILSKFQNDVKNSESQVVDYCQKMVGSVVVVYDKFQAIASQSSQYLMPGSELVIQAGVGAFSKAAQPTVTIDGSPVGLNADGVAEWKTTVQSSGSFTKKVKISFKKPDGTLDVVEKDVKYEVGSPTGVFVSADAVKVLYVGLENPISVSGGTKGAEYINASINNGSLVKLGGGKYTAKPQTPGNANITVSVDGKSTSFPFKVKRIPDPTPMVGTSGGGSISANAFKANLGVRADMKDFVFEGVKFSVTKYTLICTGKGFETTGPAVVYVDGAYFSAAAKAAIERCRAGSTVIIQDISVTGPDGSRKLGSSVAFNLSN